MPEGTKVYYPDPTWPNHLNCISYANLEMGTYSYYDPTTKMANF